jgi:hypothetical protein
MKDRRRSPLEEGLIPLLPAAPIPNLPFDMEPGRCERMGAREQSALRRGRGVG